MTRVTAIQSQASSVKNTRIIAVGTLILGLALVFLTGFSHSATIHNAAHDVRHSVSFPCH